LGCSSARRWPNDRDFDRAKALGKPPGAFSIPR
jgi:hypothetical protein